MKPRKHSLSWFSILLIVALLVACGSPAAAPTATSVPPTATPIPPPPTPVPPTPEPTAVAEPPAAPPPAAPGKVEIKKGEITSEALAGNLLGDPNTRKFYVVLPPSYATSDKHYPVVYVLHGYMGHAVDFVAPVKRAYETALSEGDLQEMILVFPDGSGKLGGSWYPSSPTIGDYETYLTQEVVELIDSTYRTIPNRTSRGIMGCSGGGDASMYLALKYPSVFSVTAPASASYDWSYDLAWDTGPQYLADYLTKYGLTEDILNSQNLPWQAEGLLNVAAAAASNPDKPPLYLDMPITIVDGKAQIAPEVLDKILAVDPSHEVERYLLQPERLNAILIYHGTNDPYTPIDLVRDFDKLLTDRGIDHEYLEVDAGHCNYSFEPVVKFMSDNLVGAEQQ